jgi:hypothetical protein
MIYTETCFFCGTRVCPKCGKCIKCKICSCSMDTIVDTIIDEAKKKLHEGEDTWQTKE